MFISMTGVPLGVSGIAGGDSLTPTVRVPDTHLCNERVPDWHEVDSKYLGQMMTFLHWAHNFWQLCHIEMSVIPSPPYDSSVLMLGE